MTAGGYKESYCEGYVDQQSGSSSVISAGNKLQINAGSLTNIGSLISAGNSATISVAGPVVNEAQTLNAYWHSHWVQETGLFSSDKRHDVWACGSSAECTALYGSAYTSAGGTIDPPQPVGNIAATIQAPNLSITSNGQIQNVGNVIGTSVTLTGQKLINGITTANTYTPRVNAPSQVISLSPVSLPGLNLSMPRVVGGTIPTPVAGKASYVDNSLGTSALGNLGAQDLLNALPANLQPSSTLFYYNPQEEDLMLQQAALQQTGKASFIDGLTYDSKNNTSVTEQEKAYLYQNALDYAKANNLQLGNALTQTQVNALDKPMLWYVEQTVPDPSCTAAGRVTCPTITALMPQVYLPSSTSAMSAGGNITGTDVTLNFNKDGGGSVLNTGSITASNTLTVNTGTLTNQANQVNVGEIWSYVRDAGFSKTSGTEVQPGGFMSAANMDLNVQTLNQIGGALQKLNADGTLDQGGTQQLLANLQQQFGGAFTQTAVHDDLHTDFIAQGGGLPTYVIAAIAIAASIVTGGATLAALGPVLSGALAGMVGAFASQAFSGNGIDLVQIAEAGAVAALTAGAFSAAGVGADALSQVGGKIANGTITATEVGQALGTIAERGLVTAGIDTAVYGGSFGRAFENSVIADAGVVGASAIGTEFNGQNNNPDPSSPLYVASHAALGCALSSASGTGCVGGAIGGAASAIVAPDVIKAIDPTGADLTTGQTALVTAISTLVGGAAASAAGQNVQGAVTAAQNEALNNSTHDPKAAAKSGGFVTALENLATSAVAWAKSTYGDPIGDMSRWGSQFLGHMQSGAQEKISQSHSDLAAQSIANGANAVMGAGSGGPPAAGSDTVLVSSAAGKAPLPVTGSTPPNAILSSNGSDDSTSTPSQGANSGSGAASPGPATNTADAVPGRVQSRINVTSDGMDHIGDRHLDPTVNASQFTISENDLTNLLQNPNTVSTPITRTVQSGSGVSYVREVNTGQTIGTDKFNNNQPTSIMTVLTDKYGNLVTAFPGKLK